MNRHHHAGPAVLHRAARLGLILGIPLAVLLGAAGVSRAFDPSSGWTPGEVLTAADLNALLEKVNALVTSGSAQAASLESLTATVGTLTAQVNALSAELNALRAAANGDPYGPVFVTSISDTGTDLGVQLNALVAQHRNVSVTLARGTATAPAEYRWNTMVVLPSHSRLDVIGEGFENGAGNLGVRILMDTVGVVVENGGTRRAPARLVARNHSAFLLAGVYASESGNSNLPMTLSCERSALFTMGEGAIVDLHQIRIESTENVVNPHGRAYGHVRFGHTFIDKAPGSLRDVVPVDSYPGWCHTGGGALVTPKTTHTHLGAGVSWSPSTNIHYLD